MPCPDGASAFKGLMTSATARDRLPEEENGRSEKSALYQDVVKHLKSRMSVTFPYVHGLV